MTNNIYMDINSLTNYIPLTKSTIYSMVSRNQIPYRKIGKKLIFNKEDINNWIEKGGRKNIPEKNLPTLKL
ncbi:helix-turn-helix domain-containing protein [Chryseobacterium indologenes]|uniref:helix-turn-helix domain-containing protein n=1 Tax=Chryseobacterium indologenes TaxID=253 RepID=UPI002578589F|nr:helix-turn-helix domain-containing protein [Chryseobacterium indologenes]MDM1556334.1 helix-turn-helix domain-containing protein [Chryseobacterium indologenes]